MKQLVSGKFPEDDGRLKVAGGEFHYIAEVRRESEGSVLHVRLPDGVMRPFKIERIDLQNKELFLLSIGEAKEERLELPRIVLFQWILKSAAMDLVVRQAAEAGVKLIVPVAGSRCVPQASGSEKSARWERIVKEARQQSGSAVNTEVAKPIAVDAVPAKLKDAGLENGALLILLDEIAGSSLHAQVSKAAKDVEPKEISAAIAVGPEGGMTAEEKAALSACGFEGVHFNTNILRAETAALYGIAALQNVIMELRSWRLNA